MEKKNTQQRNAKREERKVSDLLFSSIKRNGERCWLWQKKMYIFVFRKTFAICALRKAGTKSWDLFTSTHAPLWNCNSINWNEIFSRTRSLFLALLSCCACVCVCSSSSAKWLCIHLFVSIKSFWCNLIKKNPKSLMHIFQAGGCILWSNSRTLTHCSFFSVAKSLHRNHNCWHFRAKSIEHLENGNGSMCVCAQQTFAHNMNANWFRMHAYIGANVECGFLPHLLFTLVWNWFRVCVCATIVCKLNCYDTLIVLNWWFEIQVALLFSVLSFWGLNPMCAYTSDIRKMIRLFIRKQPKTFWQIFIKNFVSSSSSLSSASLSSLKWVPVYIFLPKNIIAVTSYLPLALLLLTDQMSVHKMTWCCVSVYS